MNMVKRIRPAICQVIEFYFFYEFLHVFPTVKIMEDAYLKKSTFMNF